MTRLRRAGATPFIVDHEGKLQAGEKHKDKSPFGSAYKAWTSRSVLQFVFEEYKEESSELNIRVRQTKANFGPKIEPLGVRFTFEEKKVLVGTYDLPDEELLEEKSKPVRERILAALRLEAATNTELQKLTGASVGTIRNNLSELIQDGQVAADEGRPKIYRLVLSSSEHPEGNDNDDTNNPTVGGLFANPPVWLRRQILVYIQDPDRQAPPLCSAVAAAVLGDGTRGHEIQAEVEQALEDEGWC